MDWWPSVREGFYDRLSILSIKRTKSLADGSITSMKMRPKVLIDSIDRYHRYRSIDPSPVVEKNLHKLWKLLESVSYLLYRPLLTLGPAEQRRVAVQALVILDTGKLTVYVLFRFDSRLSSRRIWLKYQPTVGVCVLNMSILLEWTKKT
jgi:hypothetical protein